MVEPLTGITPHDLILRSNGTGHQRESGKIVGYFSWSFENDRLCIGSFAEDRMGRIAHQLSIKLYKWFGNSFFAYRKKYRVSNLAADAFDMELDREGAVGDPLFRSYRRFPE